MKKFTVIAIMTLSVVAMAGTLAVPFFADQGSEDPATLRPASSNAFRSYIGIKNTTAEVLTVSIQYWTAAGVDTTPDVNTFTLGAQQGIGFRPAAQVAAFEDTRVPACDSSVEGYKVGSALMTFVGSRGDLIGRVLTLDAVGQSAYLLPSGPEA